MMKQLLSIIITLVCCNAAFSQSDEKANILAAEKNTADAFTKHNIPFLNSVIVDNVSVITSKGELIAKQDLLKYVNNITSCTVSDMQVNNLGTVAVVTGIEKISSKDESGSYTTTVRFTDVLQKTKGQWQIIAIHATSMNQE